MSKFLVETHYTCTFKIVHELDELNEKSLSEVDNRKDGQAKSLGEYLRAKHIEVPKILKKEIKNG